MKHPFPQPEGFSPDESNAPDVKTTFLTPREAAEYYRVSLETMRRWIRKGAVKVVRVGPNRLSRIPQTEVDRLGRTADEVGEIENRAIVAFLRLMAGTGRAYTSSDLHSLATSRDELDRFASQYWTVKAAHHARLLLKRTRQKAGRARQVQRRNAATTFVDFVERAVSRGRSKADAIDAFLAKTDPAFQSAPQKVRLKMRQSKLRLFNKFQHTNRNGAQARKKD